MKPKSAVFTQTLHDHDHDHGGGLSSEAMVGTRGATVLWSKADRNVRHVHPELALMDVVAIRQLLEQSDELCACALGPSGTDQLHSCCGTDGECVVENLENLDPGHGLYGC